MFWTVLRWVVLAGAVLPFLYYLLAIYSAWRFFRRRRLEPLPDFTPPVSILKPVRGVDREAYENFASFCRLHYAEYEILFCAEQGDPSIPIIEKLIGDFPARQIRLLVGYEELGASGKVNKLCRLVREARHEVLVISDSDIRVGTDYLGEVVAPLRDPQVGAVTSMYLGLADRQLAAELEVIGHSADFFAGVLVAWQLEGVKFALGATIATMRARLAEIGGFEALVDCYVDDYELGKRIAARGYRVELAPAVVWTMYPAETLRGFFAHQLRWALAVRHSRPGGHFGMVFTQGLPWAVVAAVVAPSAGVAVAAGYLAVYLALRLGMAWTVGVWGLKDPLLRRKWWLVPLRDATAFLVWLASFFRSRINWRGDEFYVRKGRLIPIEPRAARG